MRIDALEIFHVRMPLIYPFRTSYGDFDQIDSVLAKMISGGDHGWGESSPWSSPTYSPEWAAGVFALVRDWLGPYILGKEIPSGEQLQEELSLFKGNPFAKASLDMAWWDLHARQSAKPLWKILGGRSDQVKVGADFGVMESIDRLLEAIDGALQAGFGRIKLKYRPGWDVDMVAAVRQAFPQAVFHIDCNAAYNLEDMDMFKKLDTFNLSMIEQPLSATDLLAHAKLQKQLHTPICLDESITSVIDARQAIELKACGWINIKPGRVGGITNALTINNLCQENNVPVWIGGMLESAIGAAHCTALATLPNVGYPSDIFPSSRFYQQDLAEPEVTLAGPAIVKATSLAGIGCEPNPQRLQRFLVDTSLLRL